MSLPSPNLDDRKFQDIVDDVKRQIALRCPEWTDHNVSDPGVTLIELFAWMTEMMMYRMNQVPEKNYLKFLEMLGVSLQPPAPARVDLRFRLSRPIEDVDGEEAYETTLSARDTVAATVRTESEEAIEFTTDSDLRLTRPRLAHVVMVPVQEGPGRDVDQLEGATDFKPVAWNADHGVPIFSSVPHEGDALYLGFEADVSANVIELDANCVQAAPVGLDERYPAQVWEFWDAVENRWERLECAGDTTYGFNRPGRIELAMPYGMVPRLVGGRRAHWVRCRYTTDPKELPPKGTEGLLPSPYQRPPEVRTLMARTVGGQAPASNAAWVSYEELGQSDGAAGQVFRLRHHPILPRRYGETLLVGEQGTSYGEMEEWTEVQEFSQSGPEDRHFVCDSHSGEIYLGPTILQPNGTTHQYGRTPPKGLTLVFSGYRHGGGLSGNVKENQIRVLKSSVPYIADVTNPRRADGGHDQETLERAKMRGRAVLRTRETAVTTEEFEHLAGRASSGVGRAHCVQPTAVHAVANGGSNIPPGVVRVLIVPPISEAVAVPRPHDLRVPERVLNEVVHFLDQRRLLTTVLEVAEPNYLFVSTDITLVPDPRAEAEQVAKRVRERLQALIHPLRGGPLGDGWPFRRTLTLSDVYAQVGAVSGVAFLLDARIFVSEVVNRDEGILGPEQLVPNQEGVRLGDSDLLCTREHRIRVRPIQAVGLDEADRGEV